jgi:hypothetical protein
MSDDGAGGTRRRQVAADLRDRGVEARATGPRREERYR